MTGASDEAVKYGAEQNIYRRGFDEGWAACLEAIKRSAIHLGTPQLPLYQNPHMPLSTLLTDSTLGFSEVLWPIFERLQLFTLRDLVSQTELRLFDTQEVDARHIGEIGRKLAIYGYRLKAA